MFVKKQIQTYIPEQIEFEGAILLSSYEAETYLRKKERQYGSDWWLCTADNNDLIVRSVYDNGIISSYGDHVYNYKLSIRPALKISYLGTFQIGDIFKIGQYEFKIIVEDLAWLYNSDIGYSIFGRTNDYNTSQVKQIIDEWYEKEILGYAERDLED